MKRRTFIQTALACILTGLVSAVSALRIGQNYLNIITYSMRPVATTLVLMYIGCLLVYIFTSMRKNASDPVKGLPALAFWQGALRYVLAFDICVFGIGKFFDIQFNIPLAWLTTPLGSLPSHELLFAFYGRYGALARIVGVMQIAGGLLLIFRRTRLAGVIFLLPIVLHLLLLNAFYLHGTLYYVIILTMALSYLLLIDYSRLKQFFLFDYDMQPLYRFKSNGVKMALKAFVIIGPLILMAMHKKPQYFAAINGEYRVDKLSINNQEKNLNTRDSILTKVFIDREDFILEYNGHKQRIIGEYKYNSAKKEIKAWWYYPEDKRDTLYAKILPGAWPGTQIMEGRMGNESFNIEMTRINK